MLNPDATSLLNLNLLPLKSAKTESPLTRPLSGLQLLALEEKPLETGLPVMSVAVERAIKDTTAVATRCADPVQRDGLVMLTQGARKKFKYSDRNRVWGI
jgi:hypothetical protein